MKINLPFNLGVITLINVNYQNLNEIEQHIKKTIEEFNSQYGGILSDTNFLPYKLNAKLVFVNEYYPYSEIPNGAAGVHLFRSFDDITQTIRADIQLPGYSSNYLQSTLTHELRHLVNGAVTGMLPYNNTINKSIIEGIGHMTTDQYHSYFMPFIKNTYNYLANNDVSDFTQLANALGPHTSGACLVKYLDPKSIAQYMKDCRWGADYALNNLLQTFSFNEFKNWVKNVATNVINFDNNFVANDPSPTNHKEIDTSSKVPQTFNTDAKDCIPIDSNKVINAIDKNDFNAFQSLLKNSGNMCNAQDLNSFLAHAIVKNSPEIVKYLLNNTNIDVNAKNGRGESAAAFAILFNRSEISKLIFDNKKVDFNSIDNFGNTLLHTAVERSTKETVEYLLNNTKIDINAKNHKGKTALDLSNYYRKMEISSLIENRQNELAGQNNNMIKFYEDEGYASDSPLIGDEPYTDSPSY